MKYEVVINTVLDRLLSSNGLTMVELSEKTGIKYARLVSWRHKNAPKVGPEIMICAIFFDVSLSYLLYGKEQPELMSKEFSYHE
jgi:transcriptional regulator with XRE-family HTH domain